MRVVNATIDLVMGVLARHHGEAIENDDDLPVCAAPSVEARQEKSKQGISSAVRLIRCWIVGIGGFGAV